MQGECDAIEVKGKQVNRALSHWVLKRLQRKLLSLQYSTCNDTIADWPELVIQHFMIITQETSDMNKENYMKSTTA